MKKQKELIQEKKENDWTVEVTEDQEPEELNAE
jgi:hypothetical protein